MSDAPRPLPEHPSLEQLRKQAKDLLPELRAGSAAVVSRVRALNPNLAEPGRIERLKLADAQFIVAREHGFESWGKLVEHIEEVQPAGLRPFERLAETIAAAYSKGDWTAIRRLNAEQETAFPWDRDPVTMQRRLTNWFASTDRVPAVALADARFLVAHKFNFDSWDALVASMKHSPGTNATLTADSAAPPFYRIDAKTNTIHVRGPLSDHDWDTVFAVMKERQITGLGAGGQMSNAALQRLSRLDHVTQLFLGGSQRLTDDGLTHLANLPKLEELDLSGWESPITDRGLEMLRHLRELKRFQMSWPQRISDVGAANLRACDRLERVNLMGTPTGDGVIDALAGKTGLRQFTTGRLVTDAGLALLHRLPVFKTWHGGEIRYELMGAGAEPNHLMVDGPFTNEGLANLAGLDGLFALSVFWHSSRVDGDGVAALIDLPNLGFLGWGGERCDDAAMRHIGSMPKLRMLMAQGTVAGDSGFQGLSRSRSIEYVWGRECPNLTGRGFTALAAMPALQGLAVSCKRVDDAALSTLPRFPALRQLMPMDVSDDGFRHVGQCERLERLWCMYCRDTGDAATAHLTRLRRLKTYYAGSTQITDRSLELLGAMTSLEDISLWDCFGVTDTGIAALAALPHLRKLTIESLPQVTCSAVSVFRPGVQVSYAG